MGLGISVSCRGGGRGGGLSCPPSTGTECAACQPGENLYTCAISSSNNTICALNDFTADQHCAALNSVVQSKQACGGGTGPGEDGDDGPGGGGDAADETGASDRAPKDAKAKAAPGSKPK